MNRFARLMVNLVLLFGLAGCDVVQPREDMVPTSLSGIDHLPDHLSVQDFWVNGASGHQAGTGGSIVCCGKLPRKWRPDLTVLVSWGVTNWRDCTWESHERRVPVERYEHVGSVFIHFLSDGSVRAISSNISPGYGNKDYPGPHDPIASIRPSKIYGAWSPRCPVGAEPILIESLDE